MNVKPRKSCPRCGIRHRLFPKTCYYNATEPSRYCSYEVGNHEKAQLGMIPSNNAESERMSKYIALEFAGEIEVYDDEKKVVIHPGDHVRVRGSSNQSLWQHYDAKRRLYMYENCNMTNADQMLVLSSIEPYAYVLVNGTLGFIDLDRIEKY